MRARRLVRLLTCLAVAGVSLPPAGSAEPAAATRPAPRYFETREPRDCIEGTPASYGFPDPGSDTPLVLDALFLTDGLSAEEARAVATDAAVPYEKLGIELRVTVQEHRFEPDGFDPVTRKETINGDVLMASMKSLFPGSERPPGIDVVYTLTTKELWDEDIDGSRDYGLAGRADCIGGVRYPERAFAIGEVDDGFAFVVQFAPDFSALVAAHEIGHLMGAHHHYAVCGTTAGQAAKLRVDVCTTMFPEASAASLEFSPQNGLTVYGHAQDYAS